MPGFQAGAVAHLLNTTMHGLDKYLNKYNFKQGAFRGKIDRDTTITETFAILFDSPLLSKTEKEVIKLAEDALFGLMRARERSTNPKLPTSAHDLDFLLNIVRFKNGAFEGRINQITDPGTTLEMLAKPPLLNTRRDGSKLEMPGPFTDAEHGTRSTGETASVADQAE